MQTEMQNPCRKKDVFDDSLNENESKQDTFLRLFLSQNECKTDAESVQF